MTFLPTCNSDCKLQILLQGSGALYEIYFRYKKKTYFIISNQHFSRSWNINVNVTLQVKLYISNLKLVNDQKLPSNQKLYRYNVVYYQPILYFLFLFFLHFKLPRKRRLFWTCGQADQWINLNLHPSRYKIKPLTCHEQRISQNSINQYELDEAHPFLFVMVLHNTPIVSNIPTQWQYLYYWRIRATGSSLPPKRLALEIGDAPAWPEGIPRAQYNSFAVAANQLAPRVRHYYHHNS